MTQPAPMPPPLAPAPPPPPLTSAPQGRRFSPLMLVLGGCGCLGLLCVFGITMFAVATGQGLLSFLGETPTPTVTPLPPLPTVVPSASPTRSALNLGTPAPTLRATSTRPSTAIAPSRSTPTPVPGGRTPPALNLTSFPRVTSVPAGNLFAPIKFAAGVLDDEKPIGVFESFPSGMTIVYAVFDYSGMANVKTWKREWLLNGKSEPDLVKEGDWNGGPSGTWWVSLYNEKGITPGEWTLNLYAEGKQQQSGKMRVDTAVAGQPNFSVVRFAESKDSNGDPVDPVPFDDPSFTSGVTEVYAFFKGVNMARGTTYTTQWFRNNTSSTTEATFTWNDDATAQTSIRFFNNDGKPLATGVYEFRIKIGGKLVKLASFSIAD